MGPVGMETVAEGGLTLGGRLPNLLCLFFYLAAIPLKKASFALFVILRPLESSQISGFIIL